MANTETQPVEYNVSTAAEALELVKRLGDEGNQWQGLPQGADTDERLIAEVDTKSGPARIYAPSAEDAKRIWSELF